MKVLKGGKEKPSKLEQQMRDKFGNMPDVRYADDHADILVPKENITGSGKAVIWFGDFIDDFEKDNIEQGNPIDPKIIESLKGVYLVFRDCSLLAKCFHQIREMELPKNYRNRDLIYRFTLDKKHKDQLNFEIGLSMPIEEKKKEEPFDDDL